MTLLHGAQYVSRRSLRCQQWTSAMAGCQRWSSTITGQLAGRSALGASYQAVKSSRNASPQLIGVGEATWAPRAKIVQAAPPNGLYALERADHFLHPQILLDQDEEIGFRQGKLSLAGFSDQWRAVRRECLAVSRGCGLLDFSSLTRFILEGPGSADMLQYLCTNNVAGPEIPLKALKYTMLTDEDGGVIGSMTILKMAKEKYMLMCYALSSRNDFALLQAHLPVTAQFRDVTWDHALLMITGPQTDAVMRPLMSDNDWERVAALANFTAGDVVLGGVPTTVSRVSYCGGLGYELHAPKENGGAASLYEQLQQSQAADVTEFGYTAMQVMRTEVARPCFTVELPQGINYVDCVPKFLAKLKDHQADFCGRDAIKSSAASKMLVHLQAEDPHFFLSCMNATAPAVGGPQRLLLDGEDVGYVTSGFYGFRAGRAVMFALVDKRPDLGLTGKKALSQIMRGRLAVTGADGVLGSVVSVVSDAEGLISA